MTQPIRLAAQIYTIRASVKTIPDFAESMRKVRAMGYTGIQLDWDHHRDVPPAAIKQMCDDAGLVICCSHFDYDLFVSELHSIIERQQIWDCAYTAIVEMPERYHAEGESGYQRFAAEATEIGAALAQARIVLSYHNHSFEFVRFGGRSGLATIFAESDPRYLQAELDTYWIQHGGGDPAAWIRQLSNRMPVVHFKDMVMSLEGKQLFAEVGAGNLNWQAIWAATEAASVNWCVVEQDFCPRDPFESLQMSHTYLAELAGHPRVKISQ
ncbi:MAG: sugar phosphate isomerase/epimerase [Caldilineaceae bacterium]|nr:sugar phosphate isomerase/epimerase [Caldilineaceae bacterium]